MNYRNVRILTLLTLAVMWLASAAQAQYARHVVTVTIPFDFTANNKTLPSGTYHLVCTPGQLDLRDAQEHSLVILLSHSVESLTSSPATKLQFSTANGDHALLRVWVRGERNGYELPRPKAATDLAKQQSHAPIQISGNTR